MVQVVPGVQTFPSGQIGVGIGREPHAASPVDQHEPRTRTCDRRKTLNPPHGAGIPQSGLSSTKTGPSGTIIPPHEHEVGHSPGAVAMPHSSRRGSADDDSYW
jgi:hypothetical protein